MQAGAHNGISKTNIVLRAATDISMSLELKRERMRKKEFVAIGRVETILFDGSDRDFNATRDDIRPDMLVTGRRLYWSKGGPWLGMSVPEDDLIFAERIAFPLPRIPDSSDDRKRNPYKVDIHGKSHLAEGAEPQGARTIAQRMEDVASGTYRNFLIFQPVAQIICLMAGAGGAQWGALGSHKMPLSSLSGADGRKMALLIDPSTGEAFFSGGRYCVDSKAQPMMSRRQLMDAHAARA